MPRANEQIGPYTLIRQLGRGGFGVVWLAERRGALATTQVALKLTLDDEPDIESIRLEAELWARIGGHANVLPIIEADVYDSYVVIVSEYAPDGSLAQWLDSRGGFAPTIGQALRFTDGILAGLEHLHARGVIHRDLKPQNILLQGETPRLADFGLARVLKATSHSGGVAGTPGYMSPEAFDGKRSERSDLWAVGVLLYQLLSGRLPFPHSDIGALVGAILMKAPDPLPSVLPLALRALIERVLEKVPNRRFSTAAEMRGALAGCGATLTDNSQIVLSTNNLQVNIPTISTVPLINRPSGLTLLSYEYSQATLDDRGRIISKQKGAANYLRADLNGIALDLVHIPAGEFQLGSAETEKCRGNDESPRQDVSIDSFYLGKYPITQAQWQAIAAVTPIARELKLAPSYFSGDQLPVERISWHDAIEFCARLSNLTGNHYRLPTEAEWEYACRAGTITAFAFGETITSKLVNHNGRYQYERAPKGSFLERTNGVGEMGVANSFGLYDMHGNVWEWCLDLYRGNYQAVPTLGSTVSSTNQAGMRVMRGGSWSDIPSFCRSACRQRSIPGYQNFNLGMRVVLEDNR